MIIRLHPYQVLAHGVSDIGSVRQNNEDVWGEVSDYRFYVLADGMGGHQAGEIAARETVNLLCRIVEEKIGPLMDTESLEAIQETLGKAIQYVNLTVFKMGAKRPELKGMGTTLCCLLFHADGLILAHVGDSRIYRLRDKKLKQITKDHSLVCDLLDQGQINDRQANDFMYKNIITKAIGTESRVIPALSIRAVQDEDLYLMCSDGLSDLLSAREIEDILNGSASLAIGVERLIAAANKEGGFDNITAVIVKIKGINEQKDIS